jgi:hypothetical protein
MLGMMEFGYRLTNFRRDTRKPTRPMLIFFKCISGGGVQLGPLCTTATNRPIVLAPGDYDDGEIGGMMIGKGK